MVSFSESGLLGRITLPITRWMNRKNAPTTPKTTRKNTRVATGSAAVGIIASSVEYVLFDLLASRETGIEFMPVRDLGFPQPPAQVNFPAVAQVAEIDEAREVILQFDVEFIEFQDIFAHLFLAALELILQVLHFFPVRLIEAVGFLQ